MTTVEFSYAIFKFSSSLRSFALKLTKDRNEADDLLQETYFKAIFNKEKFSPGTNLKAWLFTIMKNIFISGYQRLIRRKTLLASKEDMHFVYSPSSVIQNGAFSTFTVNDINAALSQLEEAVKEPFLLYYNGWKYHEIAVKLSIPIGTVKNRIHLCRKQLKENLVSYAQDFK